MRRILIVAYGNPLRSDDGIGWRAADVLAGRFSEPEVEILCLHQLAPEIADSARNRELVLFVDAACMDDVANSRPGDVRVREIRVTGEEPQGAGQFSHVYSPTKVLGLARELYGARPEAFVITVIAENFGHGDCLSSKVAGALPELVARIEGLVRGSLANRPISNDRKL